MSQLPLRGLPRAPGSRAPLAVGDEAWCFLHKPQGDNAKGKNRATLTGCARVRIEAIAGEAFDVLVLLSNGHVPVGARIALDRAALYACRDREEHAAFGAEVARFWPEATR